MGAIPLDGGPVSDLRLVPVTRKQAREFVARHHRHSQPHLLERFHVGLENGKGLVGVAVAGNPSARLLCDGETIEVTRCCTTGERNAASMLYGAILRAAKALGYRRAFTYTLASEPGSSLRASGWVVDKTVEAQGWDRPNRSRQNSKAPLFGEPPAFTPADRIRWKYDLA